MVWNTTGSGYDLGSDMIIANCQAANNGYEGFRSIGYGTSLQIDNCKSYSNGTITASRGVGFYFGSNGAGIACTNLDAQDNFAEGVVVEDSGAGESHNITINGLICDSNSSATGTYSGLRLSSCHDVQVRGYVATDRYYGSVTSQTHALKVTNPAGTNYSNSVQLVQSPTDEGRGYPTMLAPIDPASDLLGTDVQVGASGGGQIAVTVTTGVVAALDPYKGANKKIPVAANITTIPAPSNLHRGCRMRLTFTASGAFTVGGWNAVYKGTASLPSGAGANGQFFVAEFECDGTNWYQTNGTVAWRA